MPPASSSSAPGTVTTASGITLPMTAAMARSSGISLRTGRPKRKKASRACFHCQKAHLTCDDARPCQRCVKRGLSATCQDGVRKKAKYLHDAPIDPSKLRSIPAKNTSKASSEAVAAIVTAKEQPAEGTIDPSSLVSEPVLDESPDGSDGLFSNFDLSTYDFGSKTANMEFSYLSNMIGTNGLHTQETFTTPPSLPGSGNLLQGNLGQGYDYGFAEVSVRDSNWASRGLASLLSGNDNSPQNSASPPTPTTPGADHAPRQGSSLIGEVTVPPVAQTLPQPIPTTSTNPPLVSPALPSHLAARRRRDPETVYAAVTQPFSYTPGYHGLIAYLKSRFDRPHLMRVARCMAAFRPSFIACTKTLKEEDLIFMEKCFQRTLLEYEKFISYSGTPTIVWRRTGQVAAVGKEFCILTGWTKEQLLGKRTFVVELMDDHSVLEYFEGFSKLAFGDSRGATMMECTLISPTGRKIPTACTWTIKRDVFDIPMMIVGNFLPILS
ncbi:hypothetical protein V1517DRAFT_106094 [Lipomyces orientalis]|uniref:Uncharacterized protein n=1 Tax=Lipomyces orientalis TaxID=1233043 RepID=A0ACC3TQ14_9ASCO